MEQHRYQRTVVVVLSFLFLAFVLVLQGSLGLRPMVAQSSPGPTPTATPEPTGTITGTVFDDADGDGVFDAGESGIAGVTVQLWQGGGSIGAATTNSSGVYTFGSQPLGDYTVREIDPVGYTSTTPNAVDVTLSSDGQVATVNFGDIGAGVISGTVYDDLDGSGTREPGEPGLDGVTVELLEGGTPIYTATTTSAGAYAFYDVWLGSYTVRETDPPDYRSTTPNEVAVSITTPGQAIEVNFGDRGVGEINGVVFEDLNENWVQDAGESGVGGVTVELYNSNQPTETRVTAGDGSYTFADLWVGESYVVKKMPLTGYSDVTPDEINLALSVPGQEEAADFGVLSEATIEGTVFFDADQDGVFDAGESGLGGVQVRITGPINQTTNTASDGTYSFVDIPLGTYFVRESDPSGFSSTTPNSVTVVLDTPAQVEIADFGDYALPGDIGGVVFDDLDGNGVQGGSEPGLSGVTVALRQSGATISTTTTAGDGSYSFPNVPAGAYVVRETDPAGYTSITPNDVSVSLSPGGSATANFADQRIGTVSGVVYEDLNGDGARNGGEPGIAGVTVELLQSGSVLSTTLTDASGVYSFTHVNPGSYTVRETDPAGYVSTTPNAVAVSVSTSGGATANFGDQQIGTVSGVVYEDLNGNGARDAGESGIGGVTIDLLFGGSVSDTTTTASDGSYSFSGVAPGSYTVRETDPAGYVSTTPNQRAVSVASGGSATANFGDQPVGTVSGVVFNDLDGNGVQDAGEGGLAGVTVELWQSGALQDSATTDASGVYSFTGVLPGNYTVQSLRPAGFVNTTPQARTVVVPTGGSATANFGYQQIGTVSGSVFNDANGNGVRDAGEAGIGGVVVYLTGAGTVTTTTSGDGTYLFSDVASDNYDVNTDPVPGFVRTTPATISAWVAPGGSASASFGFRAQGQVTGVAFNDLNGDGVRVAGELGIGGVVITLTGSTETFTTTTAGDGSYSFPDVAAGVYVVEAAIPAGFVRTTPGWRVVVVTAGGASSTDFGYQVQGTVSGVAFNDLNGNGIKDAAEVGLGGVVISLIGTDTVTTTTAGDGSYSFSGVAEGSYDVEAAAPGGFIRTTASPVNVWVSAGGGASASFGFQEQGTVSGVAFNDLNGNGVKDLGESGIGGVTIRLKGAAITVDVTAGDGSYSFSGVEAGSYVVEAVTPSGFAHTSPGSVVVSVAPGGGASANFGFQGAGTVSGVAFYDFNGNGVQEPGEGGIGGLVISLVSGTETLTTTTLPNGSYSFADVTAGAYTVESELPAGLGRTTPGSVAVSVAPGGAATANFGFRGIGTVSGVAFDDYNGNGIQDPGESGIGGVEITLSGTGTITTLTTGDGSYLFHDVAAGSYVVSSNVPGGFARTTPGWAAIVVNEGSSAGADFGFQGQDTVRGVAFNDLNGDGTQDAGEPGIGGVTVSLVGGSGTPTAVTAADGSYSFADVAAGSYTVESDVPAGFARTTPGVVPVSVAAGSGAVADFGFRRLGSLGGTVFHDLNGNGVQDAGEGGIGGVTVSANGKWGVTTTTSSADGSYSFPYLLPGSYTVRAQTPSGFAPTTASEVTLIVDPGSAASANFGFQGVGTVSGVAFNDANANGVQDSGEAGLGGLTISLFTGGGTFTSTTAANGTYLFTDVPDGSHTVSAPAVAGFVRTTPGSVPVLVSPGGAATANFGYQQTGTVAGVAFNDLNSNGVRDAGEAGLGGVTITLTPPSGPSVTDVTLSDGSYAFANVEQGLYTVSAADVAGFVRTTLASVSVPVAAGGSGSADFGYQQVGTLSGFAFIDANGNGVKDAGEVGIGGLVISYDTFTTTTLSSGAYIFTGVSAGTYDVAAEAVLGYARTTPSPVAVYVAPGGSGTASFGYRPAGVLSGAVFHDANGNGIKDAAEAGLSGVVVTLEGTGTYTQATGGDGSYAFHNLGAGTYTVSTPSLAGYVRTTPAAVVVTLATGGSGSADFGYRQEGTVGGTVYQDFNGDGAQDPGEPGIGGVTVTLRTNAGTVVQVALTALDGSYSFAGVSDGTYTVEETDPVGFASTTPNAVTVILSAQTPAASANFGDIPEGQVYGVVFHDFDGDGVQDAGDPGIGGVTVELYAGGSLADTVQTVGSGLYSLPAVPGTYRVHEVNPPGFISTTPDWVDVTLALNESANVNYGDRNGVTIFAPLSMWKFPKRIYLPLIMRVYSP